MHESVEIIEKLINNSGLLDKSLRYLIKNVVASCDTFIKVQNTLPRPKTTEFNETVLVDLQEI